MPPIRNATVLVIGGSSGIGYGVAKQCLSEGATVHIASSNTTRVTESVDSLKQTIPNAQVTGHICDLTSQDVEARLTTLFEAVGPLDHIVFTAGDKIPVAPVSDISLEAIQRAGHIRFAVPLLLGKLAPRYLKPGYKSSLILTNGAVASKPYPNWSLLTGYATGLQGTTRSLALDLKPLRVNLVSPGPVYTPLWGPDGVPEAAVKNTALGKIGTIDEVAEAYVYLMKDTNATGSCVNTDSGMLLL